MNNKRFAILIGVLWVSWVALGLVYVPNRQPDGSDMNSPRERDVALVCQEIPIPPDFVPVDKGWGQRMNGPAHYTMTFKTEILFDDLLNYYNKELVSRGFSSGGWSDSVGERHIVFGKNQVRVAVGYRTRWPDISEVIRGKNWNVYFWCDDTPLMDSNK